jgi:hypothetical protein
MTFLNRLTDLFQRNERLSMNSVVALLFLAMLGMGLISLTALNDKATKGYLLNKLEEERQDLVTDGEVMDMMSLHARSMTTIENHVAGQMVKASESEVTYVLPVSAVAQR